MIIKRYVNLIYDEDKYLSIHHHLLVIIIKIYVIKITDYSILYDSRINISYKKCFNESIKWCNNRNRNRN